MPALRARNLLQEFLLSSAANYEFHSASLSVDQGGDHVSARFAELLGVPPKQFMHENLNFDQSGACLNEVIRLEAASPTDATTIRARSCKSSIRSNAMTRYSRRTARAALWRPSGQRRISS